MFLQVCAALERFTAADGVISDKIRDYWRSSTLDIVNQPNLTDRWADHMLTGLPLHYPPNTTCAFQIVTSGVIELTFGAFWLERDFDFLRVYEGTDENGPLLATLTGSARPAQQNCGLITPSPPLAIPTISRYAYSGDSLPMVGLLA